MSGIFNTIIYNPLYNGLVLLADLIPWADIGVVVVIFTIIVKLILFPLAQKSIKTQAAIRKIDPELKKIREKFSPMELPVIMISEQAMEDKLIDCLKEGANDYIKKPINFTVAWARAETQITIKRFNDEVEKTRKWIDLVLFIELHCFFCLFFFVVFKFFSNFF